MRKIVSISLIILASLISPNGWAALPQTISFATESTYPPFEYVDSSGQIQGFDIELANALCTDMKVTCTFTNQPWLSLIPSLKLGKFDALISALNITDARKQQVDFTDPYYATTGSFVSMSDKPVVISKDGLKDKIVGVQTGSSFQQYMMGEYPDVKIKTYDGMQDAFLDMVAGRVDVVLGDTPMMKYWLKQNDLTHKYTMVGEPIVNAKYFGNGYGIAVKKGNTELLTAFNKALADIKANGTYDSIVRTYFSTSK